MKHLIPCLFLFGFLLTSCAEEKAPSIVGKWRGVDAEFISESEEIREINIESGLKLHYTSILEMDSMGQYYVTETSTQFVSDGEWIIRDDLLKFYGGFDTATYRIVHLTDSALVTEHSVQAQSETGTELLGKIRLHYDRIF